MRLPSFSFARHRLVLALPFALALSLIAIPVFAGPQPGVSGAQSAAGLETVKTGHHHVEHHGVRGPLRDGGERGVAVGGELHVVARELERALEGFPDRAIVVCNKNKHQTTFSL